jgi:NADPH2:quinone reductase
MTKAIRFSEPGGPEVLQFQDLDLPPPGPDQARVRHTAIGVNFIDIYHRTALYKLPLPSGLGMEGSGVVESIGSGVTRVAVGDRVAYANGIIGAYSEAANVPEGRLVKVPEGVSDDIASAALLKGLTAHYLLRRTHPVKPGEYILFHAAAGGVGQVAVQWAKSLGAVVIATVGSPEKVQFAQRLGAAYVIVSKTENIATRVRQITAGKGVPVVYDSVGRDTFMASIDSLAPLGLLVSFGNASGPVPPFEPQLLSQKGSLFFTRPTLAHYVSTPEALDAAASELFGLIANGTIRVRPPQRFPLSHAASAHRALESRQTQGSLVLIPD